MKYLYKITDANGRHLCFQVASSVEQAIAFASMYGFGSARRAEMVRQVD